MSKWIWYYGDFEMYHNLKLHTRRQERRVIFPPFWRLDDCYHNVSFKKNVNIEKQQKIIVYAHGDGEIDINHKKYEIGKEFTLEVGQYDIFVNVINITGLPCIYVVGDNVESDESWKVSCYEEEWHNVGYNDYYTSLDSDPNEFKFEYKEISPKSIEKYNNGVLYDFGEETFATINFTKINKNIDIFFGETKQEATDAESYLCEDYSAEKRTSNAKAFRYLYIPNIEKDDVEFTTQYEYLPLEEKGKFECSNEMINKIWNVAVHTFWMNSREFFMDGIKRDRWVWSGDAYQSYFINRYLFFDKDIAKRTILALRGKDPVNRHINTILDYSFYWIMSIYDYYEMTGDIEFVENIYPKMESLMQFCISRLDKNGFASKINDDWIFIDWADIDKTGAVCAEQMLLLRSLESIAKCAKIINKDYLVYENHFKELKENVNKYFWNEEIGAYIDSFESGKNNVSRHANIFALIFDYVDERKKQLIIDNVILNDNVPQIKTPYFKFYELESLCYIGKSAEVVDKIIEYWGSMINVGSTSFWEEFNPSEKWENQLGMYGDKFAKSLCHAWGASPVYLIGRYILGVKSTSVGYKTFEVKPNLDRFENVNAQVPVNNGVVDIKIDKENLKICTNVDGGKLIYGDKEYTLEKNVTLEVARV